MRHARTAKPLLWLVALVSTLRPAGYGADKKPSIPGFGTAAPHPGWLRGTLYTWPLPPSLEAQTGLHNCQVRLPDFAKMRPVASLNTPSLNIPPNLPREVFSRMDYGSSSWFAIVYEGSFWIEKPGEYGFRLLSMDGSRLYLDGGLAIANDCLHPAETRAAMAVLARGWHSLEVSYFKGNGEYAALVLEVARPGQDYEVFDVTEYAPPKTARDSGGDDETGMLSSALDTLFGAPAASPPKPDAGTPDKARAEARELFEEGAKAAADHATEEARRKYEDAARADPSYGQAWRELGKLQAAQGSLEAARVSFENAIRAEPASLDCYLPLAELAERAENWPALIEITGRLIELDPSGFPGAYLLHAVGQFQTGNLASAENSARTAEKLDVRQQYPEVRDLLGRILLQRGDAASGDEQLRQYAAAAGEFRAYRVMAPSGPRTEEVLTILSQLESILPSVPPPAIPSGPDLKPPSQAEQERFLAAARQVAVDYASWLPNFLCTQTVRRSIDSGRGMVGQDALTVEVGYYERQEMYRLTEVDGVPTENNYGDSSGLFSQGEFGTNMRNIFEPAAAAEFHFERWTTMGGRHAAVYSYRVERLKAHYSITTSAGDKALREQVGLRGEAVIDRETYGLLRLRYAADSIPPDFPIRFSSVTVDYGDAEIGGRGYLLPLKAVVELRYKSLSSKNEVTFHSYRKFSSDSSIRFAEEPATKQP